VARFDNLSAARSPVSPACNRPNDLEACCGGTRVTGFRKVVDKRTANIADRIQRQIEVGRL
jgi:hypothetical protein